MKIPPMVALSAAAPLPPLHPGSERTAIAIAIEGVQRTNRARIGAPKGRVTRTRYAG